MSSEPTTSLASARSLDLNSAAAVHQPELEGSAEGSKFEGDAAARDALSGGGRKEDKNVGDSEEKDHDNGESVHLDADFILLSEESLKQGEKHPNPVETIMESNNELLVESDCPKEDEAVKIDSKHLSGNENQVRKELFSYDNGSGEVLRNDDSLGEIEEAPNYDPAAETPEHNLGKHFEEEEAKKFGFSVHDIVWGKVRSHPWWPGQIYDLSFASDLALKYQKKDHFLVAYFGDKTFAWNDRSRLKPFESCFAQMEKQSRLDEFVGAVDESLTEVARRIAIGMSCGCISDVYIADLKYQMIENAGIKEGTLLPILDSSLVESLFHPGRLLDYIQELAQSPCGYYDKLKLVQAKAQLKAIYMSKGYSELPEICFGGVLSHDKEDALASEKEEAGQADADYNKDGNLLNYTPTKKKRRGRPRGRPPHQVFFEENDRKQKSLPELMKQTADPSTLNSNKGKRVKSALKSSDKKQMIGGPDSAGSGKRKKRSLSSLGDFGSMSASSSRVRALNIGQHISRVANEMKISSPIYERSHNSKTNGRASSVHGASKSPGKNETSMDCLSPNKLLSQLCLTAKNPTKIHRFQTMVASFFLNWKNSHSFDPLDDEKLANQVGSKRGQKKLMEAKLISGEEQSGFFHDSYWSDVMFEESIKKKVPKRKAKSKKSQRKKVKTAEISSLPCNIEPTLSTSEHVPVGFVIHSDIQQQVESLNLPVDKTSEQCNPAALILSFNDPNDLPSESDLILFFSQYGPIKEAETEISKQSGRASVMFERGIDAEVAFNSAGKSDAFGSKPVSYTLKHLTSFSLGITLDKEPSLTDDGALVLSDSGVVQNDGNA